MTTLTIHDATASGRKTNTFTLDCLTERMTVRELIRAHTDSAGLGILGEPGVNVLRLNLALDSLK